MGSTSRSGGSGSGEALESLRVNLYNSNCLYEGGFMSKIISLSKS